MSRINTNVPSIVAIHRLRDNQLDLNTRLERLSTGLRINRGADDPAGLIASETLRNEIRGIGQAIDNSERAINVISTAEGSLAEVAALLLELRSLITETANEGALSNDEIAANQLQIDSILTSIDRIANTSQFSGKKLLNGSLGYSTSSITASRLASVEVFSSRVTTGTPRAVTVQVTQSAQLARLVFLGAGFGANSATTFELTGRNGSQILSFAASASIAAIRTAINDVASVTGVSAYTSAAGGGALILNSTTYGSNSFVSVKPLSGGFITSTGQTATDAGVDAGVLVNGQVATVDGLNVDFRSPALDARLILTSSFGTLPGTTTFYVTGGGMLFQLTPQVNAAGQLNVGIGSVSTGGLGNAVIGFLHSLRSGGTNEIAQGNFSGAERILTQAINQVAFLRGRLGGVQKNQLETNINSQQIALENVSASESVIRDADLAVEVSALTRAQILVQATQVTLGIANQVPQQVLSLLG